jgi:hypothetical protein
MTFGSSLTIVLYAVILKVFFHFQVEWGQALGFERPSLGWHTAMLAVTFLPVMLIHEAGHYVAGTAFHQYCRRLVIGPVEFARATGGWATRLVGLRYAAGLVDLVPSTFDGFRLQRAVCASGGPMASLLSGLLFTCLSLQAATPTSFWIWSLSAQWAMVGLINILPIRLTNADSDGYKVWVTIRGGVAFDDVQRNLLIPSSHATPLRLRDWPQGLIRRIADHATDPVSRRYNCYLAYIHFLDYGDSRTAGEYLDKLTADWVTGDPPEYALEAAYFHGFHRRDLLTARTWLTAESRSVEPWVRLRAEAAVEVAAHHLEKARLAIESALTGLREAAACGAHQYEIDRLKELDDSLSGTPQDSAQANAADRA